MGELDFPGSGIASKWGSQERNGDLWGCNGDERDVMVIKHIKTMVLWHMGFVVPKKIENPHSEVHGNIAHTERDGFFFGRMCSEPELAGKNEQHCAYFSIQTIWNSDSG